MCTNAPTVDCCRESSRLRLSLLHRRHQALGPGERNSELYLLVVRERNVSYPPTYGVRHYCNNLALAIHSAWLSADSVHRCYRMFIFHDFPGISRTEHTFAEPRVGSPNHRCTSIAGGPNSRTFDATGRYVWVRRMKVLLPSDRFRRSDTSLSSMRRQTGLPHHCVEVLPTSAKPSKSLRCCGCCGGRLITF